MAIYLNIILFILLLSGLIYLQLHFKNWSLSRKVFIALILGLAFGITLQLIYHNVNTAIIHQSVEWFNIIGNGYVKLLQMVVMPLIFVSILSAVAKLHNASSLGKISCSVISLLLFTTFISAIVAILVSYLFNLSADGLALGSLEQTRAIKLQDIKNNSLDSLNVPNMILAFLPSNPFQDLAGLRSTSIMGVVILAFSLALPL